MGKNAKNKNKVSGAVKTAAKTEKKFAQKMKKELANLGEEDIEKVVAQLEKEETKKNAVVETALPQAPEPRAYASLTPHPTNTGELLLFGGEYHDGKKTTMYNELLVYTTSTNKWRKIKAPGAPPPRSAHQAVATAANKGELWIFGGEFTSPSETQFYHYKDLWCFSLTEKKWEKVLAPGGPSARSGHRMCALGKKLYVFGGYTDNGRDYRYYNDVHTFCLETRAWRRLDTGGRGPAPRSGCLLMPSGNESMIVYGGFSRTKVGKVEQSDTYRDMFRLSPQGAGGAGDEASTWRWSEVSGGGAGNMVTARSGLAVAVSTQAKRAYVFGGVTDIEETEEQLNGEMSNSLQNLDLENTKWYDVLLRKVAATKDESGDSAPLEVETPAEQMPITIAMDEVFTVKLGGASASVASAPTATGGRASEGVGPGPRMNAMMAVQKSVLYVYGGLLEKGDKQFYLSDMYALDLHKLNEWRVLVEQPKLPEWLGSDSEDDSGSESDSDGSDSDSE